MSLERKNSQIVVMFLYLSTFLSFFNIIIPKDYSNYFLHTANIALIFYALYLNKFKLPRPFFYVVGFSLVYVLINLVFVSYRYYVALEYFLAILAYFIPLYIFLLDDIDYEYLFEFWLKIAVIVSLLLPVFIILFKYKIINYAHIGTMTHFNSLVLTYTVFVLKKYDLKYIGLLLINLFIGLVIGSRMMFFSAFVTSVFIIIFLTKDKSKLFKKVLVGSGVISLIAVFNLRGIVAFALDITRRLGINSRNLYLLNLQLTTPSSSIIQAGRGETYKLVIQYIKDRSGLPGGLAVTRHLTNGEVYFAHNLFLDLSLVFGVIGGLVLLILLFKATYSFVKEYTLYNPKVALYLIILISFLARSMTGGYFLNNNQASISIALLISTLNFKNAKLFNLNKD